MKKSSKSISKTNRSADGHAGISSLSLKRGVNKFANKSLSQHSQRVSGSDIIGFVTTSAVQPVTGTIIFSKRNASNPINTRLERLAPLYKRWKAHKYSYRFIPTQPTTLPGMLCFGQDPDPIATYSPTENSNINRLMTLEGAQMRQVWQATDCSLSPSGDYTSLWTADLAPTVDAVEDRLAYAGQYIICISSVGGITANMSLGLVELNYDIEFFSPNLSFQSITDHFTWSNFLNSAWQTFAGTHGNDSYLSYFVELANSTFVTSEFTGALFKVLRDFIPWVGDFTESKNPSIPPYTLERRGLPAGEYLFEVFIATVTPTAACNVIFEAVDGDSGFWRTGAGTSTVPANSAGVVLGPDGIAYSTYVEAHLHALVSGDRGTLGLRITPNVTWPANTRIFMRTSLHNNASYYLPSTPSTFDNRYPKVAQVINPSYKLAPESKREEDVVSASLAKGLKVRTSGVDDVGELVRSTELRDLRPLTLRRI